MSNVGLNCSTVYLKTSEYFGLFQLNSFNILLLLLLLLLIWCVATGGKLRFCKISILTAIVFVICQANALPIFLKMNEMHSVDVWVCRTCSSCPSCIQLSCAKRVKIDVYANNVKESKIQIMTTTSANTTHVRFVYVWIAPLSIKFSLRDCIQNLQRKMTSNVGQKCINLKQSM